MSVEASTGRRLQRVPLQAGNACLMLAAANVDGSTENRDLINICYLMKITHQLLSSIHYMLSIIQDMV